ncbi:unnamed protein product [Nippostrongylus brasiliensis]|uniref:PPM-type phosphatase domain-containing protein n=1 Tax=Nippostrongylus brasiliensis TaxID=27835 RepID=A0A0N4Y1G0_NIPBR|nr:unnamed protein product [Nippostrongylus brasiliensis]
MLATTTSGVHGSRVKDPRLHPIEGITDGMMSMKYLAEPREDQPHAMRDMRDAGGALGPVDGRNPQLHNLTCSMTFVEEGDVVFITSDGVSDNFDPVVGKFCVIKKAEFENKENAAQLPPRDSRKLSVAKRRTLENPELYKKEKMTKSEQRARRRAVREKIADMPGKLDHASVVAYYVGRRNDQRGVDEHDDVEPSFESKMINVNMENFGRMDKATCCATLLMKNGDVAASSFTVRLPQVAEASTENQTTTRRARHPSDYPLQEIVEPWRSEGAERSVSPYEQLPVHVTSSREVTQPAVRAHETNSGRKKHSRSSTARHTLGVDVQWLKRFVTKKDDGESAMQSAVTPTNDERNSLTAMAGGERVSLRQRLRVLLGSNRNLHSNTDPQIAAEKQSRPQVLSLRGNCKA